MNLWSFINEKKLAENLLKNKKVINESPRDYIVAYIKYLKNELKLSKKDIRNKLDDFLIQNLTGFIVADWDEKLQRWVNKYSQTKNCSYKEGKQITIYEEELKSIKEVGDIGKIKSIEIEKVLFIMLVLAKSTYIEGKELWCNYQSKDIFNLARYKYKTRECSNNLQREYLLYDLKKETKDKYIEFGGENIKLLFGNKSNNIVIDNIVDENNINNIIIEYLKWRNLENYSYCINCGKEIKQNKNETSLYCTKCRKKIKQIQTNNSKIKVRKKDEHV